MSEVAFDRETLGVSAQQNWHDNQMFGQIGSAISQMTPAQIASDLPFEDSSGTKALRSVAQEFKETIRLVVLEFSDACGTLGSGQQSALANYDDTEYQVSELFFTIRN